MPDPRPLDQLTADDFQPHIDSEFTISPADTPPLTCALRSVRRGPGRGDGRREHFSLLFDGTPGTVLPQRIYRLDHPVMGTMEIFLVPLGATPEATTYEAVFA